MNKYESVFFLLLNRISHQLLFSFENKNLELIFKNGEQ